MNIGVQNKSMSYYLGFFALFYVLTVLVGIFNNYSAVPFWDMWNGYLEFYTKVQSGEWYAWFAQHNEHRVFLSRILFWIDINFFDGASYLLIICNFLLMVSIVWLFYKFIKDLFQESSTKFYLFGLIVVLMFSWMQNNNIIWGFQSQFFLAYLVPLLAFYLLARYVDTNQNIYYRGALLVGILSVLTMGNGILVLPLLIILGFVLKLSKLKQLILIAVTVLTLMIYFSDYVAPAGHGSLTQTLLHQPKEFILYIFTYLGGPIGYAIGKSKLLVIQLFGCLFIVSSLYFTYRAFKEENKKPLIFALLIFMAYIGGTAFGTAGGRAIFGVNQALESRYMTPSLMAWSSLLIVYVYFAKSTISTSRFFKILVILVPLLLLSQQIRVFKYNSDSQMMVAVLSLEMGIKDEEFTRHIFPNYDWLYNLAKEPKEKNLSIFGNQYIKDISQKLDKNITQIPSKDFVGAMDEIQTIPNEKNFYRVRGWIYDNEQSLVPKNGLIVNETGKVVGYILSGFERVDVADAISKKAKYSGFYGYLMKNEIGEKLYIINGKLNKKLPFNLNKPPYELNSKVDFLSTNIISFENIVKNSFLENKIFDFNTIDGVKIFGSFIDGDVSKGSMLLKVNRNATLVYKTGPNTSGQMIKIYDGDSIVYQGSLQVSTNWSELRFLYDNDIVVEIIDDSSQWGEWSAVGIKEKK